MIKGLYSAVSAMVLNAARQQNVSHNIANMQTPGFKQVLTTAEDFMAGHTVQTMSPNPNAQVDVLGTMVLGTQAGPEYISYEQGALQNTENPLDLALQGNGYFRVKTPTGTFYTRDGRFMRDANKTLVTAEGYQVLDDAGAAITLPDGTVSVASDGAISVDGTAVATLGIGVFTNPRTDLVHAEGNLFTGPAASTSQAAPSVSQGYLEMSNANPAQLMTQLVEVGRSYEAAQKMVQNQDELLGKAISSLGRIG